MKTLERTALPLGHLLCLLGLWPLHMITAQSIWEGLNMPGDPTPIHYVFGDTTNGTVYYCGFGSVGGISDAIFSWKNGAWDTLGFTSGSYAKNMIRYHDTLLIVGGFYYVDTYVDTVAAEGMAAYDGAHWLPYGSFDAEPRRLRIIDDTLYAVGSFSQIDSVPIQAAAKRVGNAWAAAGLPGVVQIQQVVANAAHDTIYYGGSIALGGDWQWTNAVLRYANGQWDTLGTVNDMISTIVEYHDTLLVGGAIFHVDSTVVVSGVAFHDGQGWHPYGSLALVGPRHLRVLDDTLYATGGFNMADGTACTGVARRIGGHWEPVGQIPYPGPIVGDIIKYNGELVIIGGFTINGVHNIAHYVNGQWIGLGPGILGGLSGPHSLAVYNGDLYVGGQISLSDGNPGEDIMRWDGNAFHAVGTGLQRQFGDFSTFSDCRALEVHSGLLFAGGGFRVAGGIPASGVATWNGTQWCGVGGDLTSNGNGYVQSFAFLGDTLFLACGDTADGVPVNQAAKFIGDSFEDTCGLAMGVEEAIQVQGALLFFPNPATTALTITCPGTARNVEILNILGQPVLQTTCTGNAPINVSSLAPGTYTLRLYDTRGVPVAVGRFVKE